MTPEYNKWLWSTATPIETKKERDCPVWLIPLAVVCVLFSIYRVIM